MHTILKILGIAFAVIIAGILVLFILDWIGEAIHRKQEKARLKTVRYTGGRIIDCYYWLTSDNRKPYGELLRYIGEHLRQYGYIREESVREKVDEIIKNIENNK